MPSEAEPASVCRRPSFPDGAGVDQGFPAGPLAVGVIALLLSLASCSSVEPRLETPTLEAEWAAPPVGALALAFSDPTTRVPDDPAVRQGRLNNGLVYYIRENGRPRARAELRLVVRAGSILEDEDQLGLAHFVEHMAFNGTRHFKKEELIDYLQSIGMRFGADVNASTGFDQTIYSLQVPTDPPQLLRKALVILGDWAGGVAFDPEEIDKERPVVVEEWRTGRGAGSRVRDQQIPVLFKDSRYAERLPIGKPEILESFSYEVLKRYYDDWYRPDLMAIVAVGDFDGESMERAIKKRFSKLRRPRNARVHFEADLPPQDTPATSIFTDPELTRTQVQLSYKFPRSSGVTVADSRRRLLEGLFISLLNNRLREKLQEADPPFLGASSSIGGLTRERSIYTLSATVADGEAASGLEAVLLEAERVRRHGFQESELERARTILMRSLERAYEERDKTRSGAYVSSYVSHFLNGGTYASIETELALAKALVPDVTLAEVNQQARSWIDSPDRVLLATAPEKEGLGPPTEEGLLAVIEGVDERPLEPWVDRVADTPLLAELPFGGRIIERAALEELGIDEWLLDNGVRVILKPTDFKNDEVLFVAFSPGGHSLVVDEDWVAAETATSVLALGGLGDHDLIRLQKLLTGKVVRVVPFLGEVSEGIFGGGSPDDLETVLQLIFMSFTAPRRDEEAFGSFLNRSKALIANRRARPELVFQETITEVMSQGHLRRRPFDEELLEEADLERSYRIFRERFADASDFTFVFVGSFKTEELEPLIEKYLGALPSLERKEKGRDVGVRRPEGQIERTVYKGIEPKARVAMLFAGAFQQSRQNRYDLSSMAEILRERLRKELREELGGTYGVSVGSSTSWEPLQEYMLSVGFTCDPDKVEELTDATLRELRRIRDEGAESDEIEKIQETQRRARETALQENRFWLGALRYVYYHGEDPKEILSYDERVEGLNAEAVQRAARSAIDLEDYARFVLLPDSEVESEGEGR